MNTQRTKGFTLIELLIVIAIIGILAAVILATIDPVKQRQRANEAVLKSQMEKVCLAREACKNSLISSTSTACDTSAGMGATVNNGTPSGSTYTFTAGSAPKANFGSGTCEIFCGTDNKVTPTDATKCLIDF